MESYKWPYCRKEGLVRVLDELLKQTVRWLPPPPKTFHRFPDLPVELKTKIWQEALLDH